MGVSLAGLRSTRPPSLRYGVGSPSRPLTALPGAGRTRGNAPAPQTQRRFSLCRRACRQEAAPSARRARDKPPAPWSSRLRRPPASGEIRRRHQPRVARLPLSLRPASERSHYLFLRGSGARGKVEQGDLAAALRSYQASHDIFARLAEADPGNAGWQRDLSVSHNKIGDVQRAQGDLAAALRSYQASHDIFARLAEADPGNAGWQRDLALSSVGWP